MYPIFRPLLNKGGAGRSLSREDTIEKLNPLVDQHGRLILAYNTAIRTLGDRAIAQEVERVMNRLRTELSKLKETVLACGGIPPNGVGLRDEAEELGANDGAILHSLEQHEREYRKALREALDYPHHQIRTIAILENNVTGSDERIQALRPLVDKTPRSTRRQSVPLDEETALPADLERTPQHDDSNEQPATLRREKSEEND
jgi:hypothetical protein